MLQQEIYYKVMESPVGALTLMASDKGLCGISFPNGRIASAGEGLKLSPDHPVLARTEKQLGDYFSGKRTAFDIKLDMRGSVFQIKSWRELQKIPYGETISYGEQARRLGDAKKARAVGMANGRNPLAIIVPCHRVIGINGTLTGFGGGLPIKKYLLDLERQSLRLRA